MFWFCYYDTSLTCNIFIVAARKLALIYFQGLKTVINKIEGTPILKLALVKRLLVEKFVKKFVKKFGKKIRQKIRKKFVKRKSSKHFVINSSKNSSPSNTQKQKRKILTVLARPTSVLRSFTCPQADDNLKNCDQVWNLKRSLLHTYLQTEKVDTKESRTSSQSSRASTTDDIVPFLVPL